MGREGLRFELLLSKGLQHAIRRRQFLRSQSQSCVLFQKNLSLILLLADLTAQVEYPLFNLDSGHRHKDDQNDSADESEEHDSLQWTRQRVPT